MSNIVIPDGGNIGSASDTDAISIPANGKPTFSAGIANSGTITAGTLGSSVVFPAGHIVQTVGNPTLTNYTDAAVSSTSQVGVVDITGQITITSGNHVLIYAQIFTYTTRGNSNAYGHVAINQGTIASLGTKLSSLNFGSSQGDVYGPTALWAYDSSPADATTPDYCIAIGKGSGNTTSIKPDIFHAEQVKCFLFEVQQ
tara:strand:+ start:1232 stop:1828 length:597 start_codon:yes stop_codon:yes gene_type:complete